MASRQSELGDRVTAILTQYLGSDEVAVAQTEIMESFTEYMSTAPNHSNKRPHAKPKSRRTSYFACVDSQRNRKSSTQSTSTSDTKVPKEVLRLLDTKEFCSSGPKDRKRRRVKVERFVDMKFDEPKRPRRSNEQWKVVPQANDDDVPLSVRFAKQRATKRPTQRAQSSSRPTSTVVRHEDQFSADEEFFGHDMPPVYGSPDGLDDLNENYDSDTDDMLYDSSTSAYGDCDDSGDEEGHSNSDDPSDGPNSFVYVQSDESSSDHASVANKTIKKSYGADKNELAAAGSSKQQEVMPWKAKCDDVVMISSDSDDNDQSYYSKKYVNHFVCSVKSEMTPEQEVIEESASEHGMNEDSASEHGALEEMTTEHDVQKKVVDIDDDDDDSYSDTNTVAMDVPEHCQEITISNDAEDLRPTIEELNTEFGEFLEVVNDRYDRMQGSVVYEHNYTQFQVVTPSSTTLGPIERAMTPPATSAGECNADALESSSVR